MSDATLTVTQSLDTLSITTIAGSSLAGGGTITGPLNIGVDDAGHDVKFFGDTASRYMLWDSSDDSLNLSDNAKIKLGADGDLQLYHDGSQSRISDTGTGRLTIETDGDSIRLTKGTSENMAIFTPDGSVDLYYNNVKKFETTNLGATITGKLAVNGDLDVSGTTTTFSSSSVSVADPVFTLGGVSAPSSDDNKDRGIEFHYYDSSAKKGFFGYDDSTSSFVFLTAATNNSEVFTGTAGNLVTGNITLGDGHTIGDDNFDNLALISSSGENIVVAAANDIYLNTDASGGGTGTNRVLINETAVTSALPIRGANGSASAPALSFSGDTDTGIYLPTANNIAVTAGGSEVIRFDGNLKTTTKGSVRVNGSTSEGIVIASSPTASQGLKLFNNSSTDDASILNHYNGNLILGTSNTERLRIHGGGNITIGGTAGQAMLQLEGGDVRVDNTRSFLTETAGGGVISAVSMNSSDNLTFGDGNFVIDVTGTAERMRIDSAGKVGVGTTSPTKPLDVRSEARVWNGANGIELSYSTGNTTGIVASANTSGNLEFRTNIGSTAKMFITNAGNVGVGTTSPQETIHAYSTSHTRIETESTTGVAAFKATNNNGSYAWYVSNANDTFRLYDFNDSADRLTVDGNGNVGIGTTSPAAKLDIYAAPNTNSLFLRDSSDNEYTHNFYVDSAGNGHTIMYAEGNSAKIAFSTAGNSYFNGGNVGIGTTTPETKLDIKTASNAWNVGAGFDGSVVRISGEADGTNQGGLGLSYTNSGGAIIGSIQHGNDYKAITMSGRTFKFEYGSSTPRFFIDSAGKVGIGTTSPSTLLSCETAGEQIADFYSTDAEAYIRIRDNNDSLYVSSDTAVGSFGGNVGSHANNLNISLTSGNVGIGTTSPQQKAHIVGGGLQISGNITTPASGQTGLLLDYVSGNARYWSRGADASTRGTHSFYQLENDGGNQITSMFINTAGNVGIGTTSPSMLLDVQRSGNGEVAKFGDGTRAHRFYVDTATAILAIDGAVPFDIYTNGVSRMRIDSDGDFGIGTTSPSAFLHVSKDNSNSGNQFCVADLEGTNAAVRTYTHGGDAQGLILNHYYAVGGSSNEYMRYADLVANVGNGAGTTMRFITKNAANTYSTVSIDNSGNLDLGDSQKVRLGASDDLQIYHDGTNSYIDNSSTFLILESDNIILRNNAGDEDYAKFLGDGAVELYHNDVKKFETTSAGATVTGGLTVTGDLNINGTTTTIDATNLLVEDKNIVIGNVSSPSDTTADGGGITLKGASDYTINWTNSTNSWHFNQGITIGENDTGHDVKFFGATDGFYLLWDESANALTGYYDVKLADEREIQLGATNDLRLYHSVGNNYIKANSGDLVIQSDNDDLKLLAEDDIVLRDNDDSTNFIHCINGAGTRIYHNGSQKFETVAGGITVTGKMTSDTITTAGNLELFESGNNNYISSVDSGKHLLIRNTGGANVELLVNTSEKGVIAIPNGAVQLYHDNATRLSTTTDGISLSGNGYVDLPDNGRLRLGTNNDMMFYHNGSSLNILDFQNHDGLFRNLTNDKLFIFQTTNGDAQYEILRLGGSGVDARFSQHVSIGSSGVAKDLTTYGSTSARYMKWDGSADLLNFMDNVKITLGNSNDLEIYHNGSHSYIRDNGEGGFYLQTNGPAIYFQDTDGNPMAQFTDGGHCFLMSEGTVRFQTSATGATITGNLGMGAGDIMFADDGRLKLGTGNDLQIWHSGSHSYIDNAVGDVRIYQNVENGMIRFYNDDGSGSDITEYFRVDGSANQVIYSVPLTLIDDKTLNLGTGNDLQLKHTSDNSYIENTKGDLYITNTDDDKDIIFRSDNGSGQVAEYFRLDGGEALTVFSFNTRHNDNVIAKFGTGNDLNIYHDGSGSNSIIQNETGHLDIKNDSNGSDIRFYCDDGSNGMTEYFRLDGSSAGGGNTYTKWGDNDFISLGDGSDLYIYHNGTDSYLANGTGHLYITNGSDDNDIIFQCDNGSGGKTEYFRLDGGASASGFPQTIVPDNASIRFGDGGDLLIYHTGSESEIRNLTGDLRIVNRADDKDIIFESDDGSGGTETYFYLDGSASSGNPRTIFPDSSSLNFGNDQDLRITHDGGHSYIINNNANDLYIRQDGADRDIIFQCDNGSGGEETYFYLDGSLSGGNPYTVFPDNSYLSLGTSADLLLFHNGSSSQISNGTGDLYILNNQNDGDIIFQSDDGAGGVATYFYLDGSYSEHGIDGQTHTPSTVFPDHALLALGTHRDLKLWHNNVRGRIAYTGPNEFQISGGSVVAIGYNDSDGVYGETAIVCTKNGAVKMRHDNSQKFETLTDGIKISGAVAMSETTTPTATADVGKIYTKSDNKLYFQDGAGTEHEIAFV